MITYCVLITEEITQDMVGESCMNASSIRYSLDGAIAILKFPVQFPNSMYGYTKFTHAKILEIVKGSAWSENE